MAAAPSHEIEAVVRRTIKAYNAGSEALGNLISNDPCLRVLGFDHDEYWRTHAEFVGVRTTQTTEAPGAEVHVDHVDAFQDGEFGWAILFSTFPEVGTRAEAEAFRRLSAEVRLTRYGMDCYAYALVAAGTVDLVVEAGLQAYDVQAPIAVIEAAGGIASVTSVSGNDTTATCDADAGP